MMTEPVAARAQNGASEPGCCKQDPLMPPTGANRGRRLRCKLSGVSAETPNGLFHKPFLRQRPLLPPTGSSLIARRWHLRPQLHAARDPSSWRRNRSPVTAPRASGENRPERSGCRRCPRSGSRAGDGTSPESSNAPEPGRLPCPETPQRSRPPRPRPPDRGEHSCRSVCPLIRHHAERQERWGRTRTLPPLCTLVRSFSLIV